MVYGPKFMVYFVFKVGLVGVQFGGLAAGLEVTELTGSMTSARQLQ